MMNSSEPMRVARFDQRRDSDGFRMSPMFGGKPRGPDPRLVEAEQRQAAERSAYERGLEEGRAQARREAEEALNAEIGARDRLGAAFALVDEQSARRMADRLREAAVALCTRTLAPLEIDAELLASRIERIIAMIADAERRIVRVNPADVDFLAKRLKDEALVEADASLPRGSLRVETAEGGIEDGPEVWRRAIEDALSSC